MNALPNPRPTLTKTPIRNGRRFCLCIFIFVAVRRVISVRRQPWRTLPRPGFVIGCGERQTWRPGAAHNAKSGRLVFVAGRVLRYAVGVEFAVVMFGPIEAPHRFVDGLDLWPSKIRQLERLLKRARVLYAFVERRVE